MSTLTEKQIQRIARQAVGGGSGGFSPSLLAGYATQDWVDDNYLSIEWFNSLFNAVDSNGDPILPNDGNTSNIDSIKAMFGFWTESYLSALGQGSGGSGGGGTLAGLADVNLGTLADGQVLMYDAATTHWVNGIAIGVSSPQNGQTLVYDSTTQKWVNGSAGVDMSTVWSALAAATNEQINASHLATALSDYVTATSLATTLADYVTATSLATTLADYVTSTSLATTLADYVTSTSLSTTLADYVTATSLATTLADYGTKTWIGQNYVSIAFFNRLFQAFAPIAQGETTAAQVEPNDLTTTIDNIKAMFGLWTEQYLSALGLSSGGGGVTLNEPLSSINNAALGTPQTANVAIVWNGSAWTYGQTVSSVAWNDITGKPTTLAGYGITDAKIESGVITLGGNTITPLTSESYTGTVTSVATGTGLTGGTITSSGTISIDSTYQTYISHGESAYNSLGNYLRDPKVGSETIYESTSYRLFNSGTETGIGFRRSGTSYFFVGTYNTYGYICSNFGGSPIYYTFTDSLFKSPNPIEATSFVKTNGTSSQFLKADGSVDSNTYALSSALNNYVPINNVHSYAIPEPTNYTNNTVETTSFRVYNTSETGIGFKRSGTPMAYIGCYNDKMYIVNKFGSDIAYIYIVGDDISNVGTITANTFIGSLNGNATTATTASVCSGNAATATTLQTSRTLWGNSFNGSSSIDQSIWINAGGYIDGRSTLVLNSSGCNDIVFKNGETSTGNYGAWAISSRNGESGSQYGLTFWRGGLNQGNGSEACIMKIASNGNVIIGKNIYTTTASYQLHVVGDIYATGGVTALSDARHKDIIRDTMLSVEQIAQMPSVVYRWNDGREDDGLHVGSIAQNWQSVLPEVVLTANDEEHTLSMQYGVAALVSSITIARKVVDHEQRIETLERENAELKQAYSFIKNAYDYLKMDYEQLKLKVA